MAFSEMKVLVVEDSVSLRILNVIMLKEMGFMNIVEAEDGEKAYEILENNDKTSNTFDLILSDWRMKNGDGLSLLKKVKSNPKYRDIIFIMVTSESDKESVMRAISIGISGYVIKPFRSDDVREKIIKAISNQTKVKSKIQTKKLF